MTTVDFITELFCQVAERLDQHDKYSQAKLYPSEVVTIAFVVRLEREWEPSILALVHA